MVSGRGLARGASGWAFRAVQAHGVRKIFALQNWEGEEGGDKRNKKQTRRRQAMTNLLSWWFISTPLHARTSPHDKTMFSASSPSCVVVVLPFFSLRNSTKRQFAADKSSSTADDYYCGRGHG